ncbi:MAG: archease [Candidatus Altiarchaeales archaeon]|nr:MAG: archease [Candidatus Altiarchaeales archaeon]
MPHKDFEFLEHIADLKFRSYGKTLDACFENAAKAMFSSILDLNSVIVKTERKIEIKSDSLETLLHDFLSEILFLFETEDLVFGEFHVSIKKNEGYQISAKLKGEKFNPKRHVIMTDIKAVTYHEMRIEKKDGEWVVDVLCDI